MSFVATRWAINQLPRSPGEKLVLLVLADFHREKTDLCYPSALTIAKLTLQNERTVRRCLDSLEAQGFITLKKRNRQPSYVTFNWERPGACTGKNESTDMVPAETTDMVPAETTGMVPAERPATDIGATTLRTSTTGTTDTVSRTAGTMSDKPGNLIKPGVSPAARVVSQHDEDRDDWRTWSPTEAQRRAFSAEGFVFSSGELTAFRTDLAGMDRKPYSITTTFVRFCEHRRRSASKSIGDRAHLGDVDQHAVTRRRQDNDAMARDKGYDDYDHLQRALGLGVYHPEHPNYVQQEKRLLMESGR